MEVSGTPVFRGGGNDVGRECGWCAVAVCISRFEGPDAFPYDEKLRSAWRGWRLEGLQAYLNMVADDVTGG